MTAPEADLREAAAGTDDLTGVSMPGLSANPLDIEPWWQDRSIELWVARRLHDYTPLPHEKGPLGVRPWILVGLAQAEREVAGQTARWGPLRRER